MFQDRASVEASHQRFINRIISHEIVYCLSDSHGVANTISNDDEELDVLMFWSDRAYALRSKKSLEPSLQPQEIELFDFLFRWLPGMSSDGVLAGTNWDSNLIGVEKDPFDLREEIEREMTKELLEEYERKYIKLTKDT